MSGRIREYLRQNVLGLVAIFIALNAGAYAAIAPGNSVISASIKNGEVKAPDLGAAEVTSPKLNGLSVTHPKLAGNAVASANVTDNSLTGSDIKESFLGPVPKAITASKAERVSNANSSVSECCTGIQQFFFKSGFNEGTTPIGSIYAANGVAIRAGCHDFGSGLDPIATVVTPATSELKGVEFSSAGAAQGFSASTGTTGQTLTGTVRDQRGSGQFTVATSSDKVVTVMYSFDDANTFGDEAVCTVTGIAFATQDF